MTTHVPPPPDARKEPGHSREKVHLEPTSKRPLAKREPTDQSISEQADGYVDDVKNPPGNQQRR